MNILKNTTINYKYQFSQMFNSNSPLSMLEGDHWILGKGTQETQASKSDVQKIIDGIAWFSYTQNFDPIFNDLGESVSSDAGWGCMIRTGQMLTFQCLLRYFANIIEVDTACLSYLVIFFFREKSVYFE